MEMRASETINHRDARLETAKERQSRYRSSETLSNEMQDWKPI